MPFGPYRSEGRLERMRKELEKQGQNFLILIIVSFIVRNAIIEQKNTRKLKLAPNTQIFNIKEKEKCYKFPPLTHIVVYLHTIL